MSVIDARRPRRSLTPVDCLSGVSALWTKASTTERRVCSLCSSSIFRRTKSSSTIGIIQYNTRKFSVTLPYNPKNTLARPTSPPPTNSASITIHFIRGHPPNTNTCANKDRAQRTQAACVLANARLSAHKAHSVKSTTRQRVRAWTWSGRPTQVGVVAGEWFFDAFVHTPMHIHTRRRRRVLATAHHFKGHARLRRFVLRMRVLPAFWRGAQHAHDFTHTMQSARRLQAHERRASGDSLVWYA